MLISEVVLGKVSELRDYLLDELKLSREAAEKRTERIDRFLMHLGNLADYPLCRFKKWRAMAFLSTLFSMN